ncbi:MAG: ATP-dependent RNA helicase [Acidobacteria bacterium]|nr:ATP-dependent RNA helicase [Acidobacteriota bacterium]
MLPVDRHIPEILATVRERRAAVIVAPPGSGKTTRIPPALAPLGKTILLQPRRVAARALTRRIASEQRWTIGEEIGWQIRFERRFSDRTQLLVATEGILTARLQSDPLLSDFQVVILDEFHERSIHADVALALVKQAAEARDDLAIVVMSATMDATTVSRFLGDAPIINIEAKRFPIDVRYRAGASIGAAVRETLQDAKGDVLAFLPGAREIERAAAELAGIDALVLPLHGSLEVDAQERALAPASRRKVILSTNVAETSLTVEGVTDVVDAGLHKVLRFDAETAVDHLVLEKISLDSAEQRAGRAGRTAPGRATRLWDPRDILREHREPEVRRIDLTSTVLDILSWGGDPRTFEWFEKPDPSRIEAALDLLRLLGDTKNLRRFPLHPRLARLVLAAHGARDAIALAVELSGGAPNEIRELANIARRILGDAYREAIDDETFRRAVLAGYPDRVAMRRGTGFTLATGTGAQLARGVADPGGDFLVALDVTGDQIRRVIKIDRDWIAPTHRDVVHAIDGNRVRATERVWHQKLLLREQQVPADPEEAKRLLAANAKPDPVLAARLAFAGLSSVDKRLDQIAPTSIKLPSGRSANLEYREDGSVVASAKLQELFGLAETPRLGPKQTPITFQLLAPNGRPVQVTRDLRSFWNNTYPEVRKELRGRYPRHPWPDDPWTAEATHRTKRR